MTALALTTLAGCARGPYQELQWRALERDIERHRTACSEGVCVLEETAGGGVTTPRLFEPGLDQLRPWLAGARAWGLRYDRGADFFPSGVGLDSLPPVRGLVVTGDDCGVLAADSGRSVVPGVRYFRDRERRRRALAQIAEVERLLAADARAESLEAADNDALLAQLNGLDLQRVASFAVAHHRYGALTVVLESCQSMLGMGLDPGLDVPALLRSTLVMSDVRVRRHAASCATVVRDPSLCEPLRALLADADAKVRFCAITALVRQGDRGVLPRLRQMAESDAAESVRIVSRAAARRLETSAPA